MNTNEALLCLTIEKESLKRKSDAILLDYFGSLNKLLNIAVNSEPREANSEEIKDYNDYMDAAKRTGEINRNLRVIGMMKKGINKSEIAKIMGYRPGYDFEGLLNLAVESD
jgi:hypothetical protein